MGESTLKEKTSKGLFWGGLSSFLQQLLNAVFGIYLARTLSPDDYGLVGMLAVFTILAQALQESGFISALINRKEIRNEDYNAVFWFNILVSAACYVILFFTAPLIARYYHHPELVPLARWIFLCFIFSGLGVAQRAYLTKQLKIREISISGMVSICVSGVVGVYLAYKGMAYWALVAQSILASVLLTGGFWFFSSWRPVFRLDFGPVKEMFRYSVNLLIPGILSTIGSNLLTIILGRYYSATRVGFYTQAHKWYNMGGSVLAGMVNSVAQPVFAEVTDDRERQLRVFRKMIRFAAFISFPALLGLAFVAPEFIIGFLKDKWADSVPLLQILCAGGVFFPMIYMCSNLLLSRGRSDIHLWINVAYFLLILVVALASRPFGIHWMVVGFSVSNIAIFFVWYAFVRKVLAYRFKDLLLDTVPFLAITLVSLAGAYFASRLVGGLWLRMAVKIFVTAAVYIVLMKYSKSVTYSELIGFMKKRI